MTTIDSDHNSEHNLLQSANYLGPKTKWLQKIFGCFDEIRYAMYTFTYYDDSYTICSAPPYVLNKDEIEQFRCCRYKPLHKYGYYGCCRYTSSSTFKMSLSINPKWLFICTMYYTGVWCHLWEGSSSSYSCLVTIMAQLLASLFWKLCINYHGVWLDSLPSKRV